MTREADISVPPPRAEWLHMAALVALVLLTYLPAWHLGFVNFDDPGWVLNNPAVKHGLCVPSIRYAFHTIYMGSYNPLTWLSLELDVSLFGQSATALHGENVLWHAANTVLVFLILRQSAISRNLATLGAAIFGVHPLHVESVAWITERKDLLCAFFFLLAVWLYLRRVRGWVAICFVLALLAKPMAVTLPAVLVLLDVWPLRRWPWHSLARLIGEKWLLWLFAFAASAGAFFSQRAGGEMADVAHVPLAWRLSNVVVAYAAYLLHFIWPVNLAAFYPLRQWPAPVIAGSVTVLVLLTGLAARQTALRVGWLWFLGMLLPTIGLVQVGGQAMADRYLYLPMVGLLILWCAAATDSPLTRVGGAAIVLVLAGLTVRQVGFWQNTQTLFTHTLAVTGPNAIAHVQLGLDDAANGRPAAAAIQYQQAIAIDPTFFVPEFDLGNLLLRPDPAAAAAHYARAATLYPGSADIENNWGLALLAMGDVPGAQLHFQRAVVDDPHNRVAQGNLGRLMLHGSASSRP